MKAEKTTNMKAIPIDADRFSSSVLGLSDTWVLGWLGFGLLFTAMPLFILFESTEPPPPGAEWRMLAFVGAYWLITTPFGLPRWLSGYLMARRGVIVAGRVEDKTVIGLGAKRAHRLNASYTFNNQTYKAIANPMNKDPEPGSFVLVAIRQDKPHKNRVVPYDFRLDKESIQEFRQKLEIDQ